jgi:hypothetical protein
MKFIDYDSLFGFDYRKLEENKWVYEELKALALKFNIKVIINQKEQFMDSECEGLDFEGCLECDAPRGRFGYAKHRMFCLHENEIEETVEVNKMDRV